MILPPLLTVRELSCSSREKVFKLPESGTVTLTFREWQQALNALSSLDTCLVQFATVGSQSPADKIWKPNVCYNFSHFAHPINMVHSEYMCLETSLLFLLFSGASLPLQKGSLDPGRIQALIHTSCRSESSYILLGRLDNQLRNNEPTYLSNQRFKEQMLAQHINKNYNILRLGTSQYASAMIWGIARTQSPTNKNCALKWSTFETIVGVNQPEVQWDSLILEEPPSWSWLTSAPGKYAWFESILGFNGLSTNLQVRKNLSS